MTEEFVVDANSIAELEKALIKIDEQNPKDRLEYTLYSTRNFAAASKWAETMGMIIGDVTITHRADEKVLAAEYLASKELTLSIIGLIKAYLSSVPTLPIEQSKEEKGLRSKLAKWFN